MVDEDAGMSLMVVKKVGYINWGVYIQLKVFEMVGVMSGGIW